MTKFHILISERFGRLIEVEAESEKAATDLALGWVWYDDCTVQNEMIDSEIIYVEEVTQCDS